MKSAEAGKMGVPSVPLSDLYGFAIDYIRARGGKVLLRSPVSAIGPKQNSIGILTGTAEQQFDYSILAAPFQSAAGLLPSDPAGEELKKLLSHFEASPITGIHLWFDREISALPHAVLLDRTIQWMFYKSKIQDKREGGQQGNYMEVVVSASKSLVQKSREEVLQIAISELADFFPLVKQAKLVKAAVIKEVYATYSIVPGLDHYRPGARTGWPRIFLAGDWTATGWPATMEGAVRSGYLAAEAIMDAAGKPQKFLVPDLPAKAISKLVVR
jgi:zeta-carotene desaturase